MRKGLLVICMLCCAGNAALAQASFIRIPFWNLELGDPKTVLARKLSIALSLPALPRPFALPLSCDRDLHSDNYRIDGSQPEGHPAESVVLGLVNDTLHSVTIFYASFGERTEKAYHTFESRLSERYGSPKKAASFGGTALQWFLVKGTILLTRTGEKIILSYDDEAYCPEPR